MEPQNPRFNPRAGHRHSHGSHAPWSSADNMAGQNARPRPPSRDLDPSDPAVLEKLERLDDLVFDAISGSRQAMEELAGFWPKVRDEWGNDPLVAESRVQYLRYALESWDKVIQRTGERNPAIAVQSLEVLSLLFEGTEA